MKKYRLKKEAVQYFLEKHATSIYSIDEWAIATATATATAIKNTIIF